MSIKIGFYYFFEGIILGVKGKTKFYPSNIKNEVGFCDFCSLGGYLSASFMIIPAGMGQSSGETNIDLPDGIFVL